MIGRQFYCMPNWLEVCDYKVHGLEEDFFHLVRLLAVEAVVVVLVYLEVYLCLVVLELRGEDLALVVLYGDVSGAAEELGSNLGFLGNQVNRGGVPEELFLAVSKVLYALLVLGLLDNGGGCKVIDSGIAHEHLGFLCKHRGAG